jgi:hypothetical protein
LEAFAEDLWSRFVVRRDWNFAKSGKAAAIFQKTYRSEDPAKRGNAGQTEVTLKTYRSEDPAKRGNAGQTEVTLKQRRLSAKP